MEAYKRDFLHYIQNAPKFLLIQMFTLGDEKKGEMNVRHPEIALLEKINYKVTYFHFEAL